MSSLKSESEWEVWYWQLKNRGNFIQLLFVEAGVPYKLVIDHEKVQNKIRSNFFGKLKEPNNIIYQPMAAPFIIHNKRDSDKPIILCQTEHCVGYIAEQIGLRPNKIEDHYRAQMIVAHCNECFGDLFQVQMLSEGKDKEGIKEFINGRFKIWMDILEKPLMIKKNQLFYFGDKISQSDLAVFNLLNGFQELFGDKVFNILIGKNWSVLFDHYGRIGNRKAVKELMIKQKEENIPWVPQNGFNGLDIFHFPFAAKVVREMCLKSKL